jgi:hypothetical protein
MNRQLGNWTVAEIMQYCKSKGPECDGCDFATIGSEKECVFQCDAPCDWELPRAYKFTTQECEDAKVLARVFDKNWHVKKDSSGTLFFGVNTLLTTVRDVFPSMNPGETYTLAEIVGREDE